MKKKLLSLALAVCMALTLLPTAAFAAEPADLWTDGVSADASAAFSGGDGTAGTPYLLSSATDLAQLSVNVKQKANYYSGIYFKLTTDIDLAGKYWVPIGYTTGVSTAFQGNFNGDGHIVDNMTVKRSVIGTGDTYFLGFFGWIYSGASVRNLGLANASITVDEWSGGQDVGLLVGYADNGCAVEDCFAQGAIDASVDVRSIGGLVGQNYSGGSMTNCYFIGNINAAGGTQTGGLVGDRRGATPLNCYVAAAITSSASNKYAVASSATNCYYDSTLNATVTDGQGTAKTTAEMKTADTASLLNNEGSAWAHNAGVNGGYPYLANLVPHGVVPVDTYTYNTPAPVAVNGVTATVTYDPASPQAGGTEITATVTLSGTATAAGTHAVDLTSTTAGLTASPQTAAVTAGQDLTATPVTKTFTFSVPAGNVDDLMLTHTFTLPSPTYTMDFTLANATWGGMSATNFSTTNASGTGWAWVADGDTTTEGNQPVLSLSGLNFTTTADIAMKLPGGTKLVLTDGTVNTVTSTYSGISNSFGISADGAIEICGNGTLNVTSGSVTGGEKSTAAMIANGVTITSGTIHATGGTSPDYDSFGLYSFDTLAINGGTIYATAGSSRHSRGIYSSNSFTVHGGTVNATAAGTAYSYGIQLGSGAQIVLTGGTVVAKCGTASTAQAFAVQPVFSDATQTNATWYKWNINETTPSYTSSGATAYTLEAGNTYVEIKPDTATYTYNTPAPVTVNGVTATVTYDPASPQAGGTEITATVTLSGTATAAGTHTVNLSSTQAGLTGTAQNITVSAGQTSFTVPNTYTFTVPTSAVGDLTLTHTASPYILMTNGTQTVTIDADGLTIYDDGGPSGYYSNNCHSTLTIYPASGYDQVSISGNYHIESSTWDYIIIYDGADTDGTGKVLFINYSDSTPGNMPTITSTEGYLTILFHTDSSIAYEGFNLRAVAINSAAPPSCTFSFDGDNAGKLMGATAAMEYSLDGGTSWADCTADMALAVDNITVQNGIKVRINATPDLAQTINITKAETPTTAGKTDCTTAANNDGKLTGVTTAMEYKNSDAALWTDGTGSAITGLANGTYYVRVKATGTVLASENQELIINAYSAPTAFTVTFNPNGGSVDPASAATGADGKLDSLPTPTRSGSYRFDGWYTAASGGTQITTEYVFDSDTTIYAHWTYTGGGGGGTSYSYYTITATAGDGGSISPSGSASVREGSDKTYTVTPNTGYVISDVLVDGKSAGIVETYTFEDVRKEHTIAATFVEKGLDTGAWANPFSDVTESDWFYEDVARINILDLMKGTSDTTFSPYTDTTRGMIVTILYRLENEPDTAADTLFDDVENGKYYADAVAWAADNNIVEGYGNGLFGPEDNITREQMAAILYRYAQYKGYDVSVGEDTNILSYNDVAEVSEWAIPAMQWACGAGIIRGDAGNLMPKDGATRAQAAAMLVRFIGNVVK